MKNPFHQKTTVEAQQARTPQFYRMRKALLVLPLIVLPLLTLAFWNFHRLPNGAQALPAHTQGLSVSLPGATFDKKSKPVTKMTIYDQAQQDSVRQQQSNSNPLLQKLGFASHANNAAGHNTIAGSNDAHPNVIKINQKLADINREISQPQQQTVNTAANNQPQDKSFNKQVDKLEMMMKAMNGNNTASDPQMQQLSKMLAQIQAIQHPETVKKDSVKVADNVFRAVPAIIDGNQKILQGSAVRLKLSDSIRVKDLVIPKGTLAFGVATITNQRLLVEIKNIRLDNNIIPVGLMVYDKDGMPGVPAPEAELGSAAGEGANDAVENMQLLSMDASLGAQAAAGGISAAKNLFSKKVRKIKVHLKNGYPVLLRNNILH